MRLFLDFSVGRKLAAAAGLTILMLGGLVAFNRTQMDRVTAEQAASAATDAAFERLRTGAGHVRAVAPLERDMLLAQGGPAIGAARDRALAELDAALPLLAGSGGTLGEGLRAYRMAVEALAEQRLRLVALRDQDLARATEDYDSVQEAVQSGIGFDLTGATQEEAREKFGAVQAAANDVRIGIQRLLSTGEEAQARRVRRGAAQIRVHARGLLAVEAPDSLRTDVRRLSEAGERLGAAALEVIAAGDAVAKLRAERLAPAEAALAASVATLSAGLQAEAASQRAEVVEAVAEVNAANVWAGLGVALVLVLSGVANARAIGTPMRRLSAAIARIAAGEAGQPVPDRGRRDEIGRIADALESLRGTVGRAFAQGQMIEQLPLAVMGCDPKADFQVTYMNATSRELLGRLRAHLPCEPEALVGQSIDVLHRDPRHTRALLSAPERLPHTARIRLGAEVMELRVSAIRDAGGAYAGAMLTWSLATEKARLADTFETEVGAVVEAVAASAAQLQAASRGLSEAAATSNAEAGAVSEAGGRAHREVQAVAAAAEEMAASVSEISRRVGEAAEVAGRAVQEARATDATVAGLTEAAGRIGAVVRLISDIAGQTNLLALNATIEAARAGEAGKGFAVVAQEVKQLAGQTARATEEISAQIGQMREVTAQAVAAIRGIGATVARTSEIATTIAAAVEEQGAATREIARSAAQVAEGTETVARRIEGVREAAAATEGSVGGLGEAAGQLSGQAGALREKAAAFLAAVRAA